MPTPASLRSSRSLRALRLTPVAGAAAVLVASAALSAHAQTAQPPAEPAAAASAAETRKAAAEPERIVVTGSGRRGTASKTPFNITAISEEALRDENITDAKKLIAQSIAINAPENPARFADSVTVRGLNVSPVNANNLEQFTKSTLAYYLDDTPLPNMGYRIKDVARVETLLGPQGTLYGAGSLGGTVRYITNKPRLGKVEGSINTSFYQVDNGSTKGGLSNDTDVVFNLPIGSQFALRGSVAKLDEKGWIDRISNPPWRTGSDAWVSKPDANQNVYKRDDWQEVLGGRFSALFQPFSGLQVLLAHTTQDQLANGTGAVSRLPLTVANARTLAERDLAWKNPQWEQKDQPCFPNCIFTNELNTPYAVNDHSILSRYPEYADRKFRMNSIDIDWDMGFATLHSATSQFKDSRIGQADYASQGWSFYAPESPILGGFDVGGSITSGRSAFMIFDNTYKGISHETRLTSKAGEALDWIVGVYHTNQKKNLRFSEMLPGLDAYLGSDKAQKSPLADQGYSEDLGSNYTETALYGEAGYKFDFGLRINAGVRAFEYKDTANVEIVDWAGGAVDNRYTATGKGKNKTYFKLNTSYNFSEDLLAYATFSQGFRRGGTNPFRDRGARVVADDARDYKPDSTDNMEIGLKGYVFDRSLYLETAIYKILWKDTQTYRSQDVGGFPVNGTANGPDAVSQGWEFLARYKINANWQVTYSTATVEAKWDNTKTQCLYTNSTSCRTWAEGGLLGGAPKWKHQLGTRFSYDLNDQLSLKASLTGRYQSSVQVDRADGPADNVVIDKYKSYTRYNASIGVSSDKWDVQLWVDNLTNLRLVTSVQAAGLMGAREISPRPRTVGINASYRFN
jgi:iron complex outermembrane recepter protein